MKILVIIPCYNEAENILRVYKDIQQNLSNFDFVFINDCSTDDTKVILSDNRLTHLNLPVNLGLSGAVQTGYKYAFLNGYDGAIQFDGDGQHQAKYIKEMIEELKLGNDIVIGSRFIKVKKGWNMRMFGSRIITFIIFLKTKQWISDPTSGMRLLNRKMLNEYSTGFNHKPEPDSLALQILRGSKIKEIPVEMNERIAGTSIYSSFLSSMKYMVKIVISIIFLTSKGAK